MAAPARNIDPMAGMFEAIANRVAEIVADRITSTIQQQQTGQLLQVEEIELMRAYSAQEVAHLLSTDRVESVYAIEEQYLPRVKRIGNRIGYLGINVLCYMHGLEPVDMEAVVEGYREKLMQERSTVLTMEDKPGLKRVL